MHNLLSADEAARHLGVTRATLYAYVSRGLLSALPDPQRRRSLYRQSELELLMRQRARGRRPRQAAQAALDWGFPVMPSRLTLIEHGRLYYRGQDALALADTASLETVAALLWDCEPADAFGGTPVAMPAAARERTRHPQDLPPAQRLMAAFTRLQAYAYTPLAGQPNVRVHAACGQLLRLMVAAATGRTPDNAPLHHQLAGHWGLDAQGADLIRRALVLCADHELNASSFTARCVASTGADLGAVITGGLAALSGALHGGMTSRVEALVDELTDRRSARTRLRERLGREPYLPGFGHRLYPQGDPRGRAILERLRGAQALPGLTRVVHELTGLHPTVDFALVALRRARALPPGSAFLLFAIGRTVGWLAHALEQRELGRLIRPRAAYVGERPKPDAPASGRVIRRR